MHYRCPYCQHDQTAERPAVSSESHVFTQEVSGPFSEGHFGMDSEFVVCQNPVCKKFSVTVALRPARLHGRWMTHEPAVLRRRLVPESNAQVWPDYVPEHLRRAYTQACIIVDLVPEASATMSRRCLQGMIRDRWPEQLKELAPRASLKREIDAIQGVVDPTVWSAIEAVRRVGNVAAHFEEDTNLIVDVEPDEAERLIKLLEILVGDWYVNRFERERLLAEITDLGRPADRLRVPGQDGVPDA